MGRKLDTTNNTEVIAPKEQLDLLKKSVGSKLKDARERLKLNLRDVSTKSIAHNPSGQSISTSHLSRIENGIAAPSFEDLVTLCSVLDLKLSDLIGTPQEKPWFVVRAERAEQSLNEIRLDSSKLKRRGKAHDELIRSGVYKYVPLANNSSLVFKDESSQVTIRPLIRKYLFEVGRADEETMRRGLDRHEGEETIFVIDGELEFWHAQSPQHKPTRITLHKNDCLHFSSELLHGFRATGTCEAARALFIYAEAPQSMTEIFSE